MIGWKARRMLRWERTAYAIRKWLKAQEIIRAASKYRERAFDSKPKIR